jgi:carboxypeptidase Taq
MGIHESQSLLWERMVALGPAFAKYLRQKLALFFPEKFGGHVTANELYHAMNVVEPSLIRVMADEVTYPMHIILRYELERGLMDGSITVDQLPELWSQKMNKYLGLTPPDDAHGVLQVHR